jgi:DNA-binding Lrp family transcriptional regulator
MPPIEFSETEKRILKKVQGDLPDSATPFADIAAELGIETGQVLDLVRKLKESGAIRRFGATLRHQKAGYGKNAMVAWKIPEERVDEIGPKMAEQEEISHCYIRRTYPEWRFNLYTMIHGRNEGDVDKVVERLSRELSLDEYDKLESIEELKKTSMTYF